MRRFWFLLALGASVAACVSIEPAPSGSDAPSAPLPTSSSFATPPPPTASTPSAPVTTPGQTPSASPTASPTATPTASPTPTLLPFRGHIINADDGYALTLPADWVRIPFDPGERAVMLEELADIPDLASTVALFEPGFEQLGRLGVSMFAVDSMTWASNLNVIVLPNFGTTLDEVDARSTRQLRAMLGIRGKIQKQRLQLPAGEAMRFSYRIRQGLEDAQVYQYIFFTESTQFAVTVGGVMDGAELIDVAAAIAETFEILGSG